MLLACLYFVVGPRILEAFLPYSHRLFCQYAYMLTELLQRAIQGFALRPTQRHLYQTLDTKICVSVAKLILLVI